MVNAEEEQFQMTDDEARRIKDALKNKEFMDLLIDYAKEISDPVNKKKYEEEIIAMEKQRGQDVRLLKPQSGFVIKTVRLSDNMKVFLNICTSPEVAEHEMQHVNGRTKVSLPHSLSPEREDIDKSGNPCIVYDVCFNCKSYEKGLNETNFRQTMIDSAFDTIEEKLCVKLDRKNKKFPKMKYKGQARPLILRPEKNEDNKQSTEPSNENKLNFPYPNISERNIEKNLEDSKSLLSKDDKPEKDEKPVVPKHKIIHRGYFEMADYTGGHSQNTSIPKELAVEIELPLAKSANGLDLDIFTQQLVLNSEKPSYHLDIKLPYKIDEDRGKAQFDKSKKILLVTLPILKPADNLVSYQPQTLVQECPEDIDENQKSDEQVDSTSDKPSTDNMTITQDVKAHDVDCVENEEEDVFEENPIEDFNSVDMANVTFDTKNLESMPLNSRLPPYSFDQTQDTMIVVVKVPGIQIANISLGITVQQVCLSIPQDPESVDSADWNMVIRLDDEYFFDKDECGFEVYDDRMELNLKKSRIGLWERFFIGVSETSLEMELFLTDSTATEMVEKLKALNVHKLPRATIEDEDERTAMSMEKQLEHLLNEQEKQSKANEIKYKKCERNPRFSVGSVSEGSDIDLVQIDLMDLADDVIDENSPLTSPSANNVSEAFTRVSRPFGRSYSSDNFNPRLRSILKRSKSDGAANTTDTDDDGIYHRSRAITYSDGYINHSESENELTRRRNKSVSFQDEPIVFEFTKMTKWEWKKKELRKKHQRKAKKEKKEKNASSTEQTASSADEDKTKENIVPDTKEKTVIQKQEKHGRKWKKAQKARNRNNSESRSEEEAETKGQSQKKGKRKKKNKKGANLNFVTNSGSDSGCVEGKLKPSLNNPLIFQLD